MQIRIIKACCILDNFLLDKERDMDELLINEVDSVIVVAPVEAHGEQNMITHV